MRIADELLLLAIHPAGGRPVIGAAKLDLALAGAILSELVVSGRVRLDGDRAHPAVPDAGPPAPLPPHVPFPPNAPSAVPLLESVSFGDAGSPGGPVTSPRDPALDEAFTRIVRAPGARAHRLVADLSGATLRLRLRNALIGQGILAEEEQRILGVLRSSSHPEMNPVPRREILARLDAALAGADFDNTVPGRRTASLLEIAHACDLTRVLFAHVVDLERRVAAVTAGGWAGPAVRRAITRMQSDGGAPFVADTTAGPS
ncbi:GPP34 family phosphoprotein [Actinomadura graeca]|uniref:GPP34 family phosphoprotein n=1 Tax=Actinomadura graeca TaxID=2750812 RepID=A0ABX8QX76_9ACTN|nr:GPP34 family phosphoprotein [Actinomadura graeca]QXJ22931.1 GPP34 family phosphoprotein [Actinomadura graeca]